MKNIFTLLALCVSLQSFAQTTEVQTSYTDVNGNVYKVGDRLQLGIGTSPDNHFIWIYTNPNSIAGKTNLGAAFAGLEMEIKSIKTISSKKLGTKTYFILAGGNIVSYYCDIDLALRTGEVIPPLKQAEK